MSGTVRVTGDALPWAKKTQAAMDSPRLRKVMAAEGAKTVRENFRQLDQQRHRGGRHHYYGQAARATTWHTTANDGFIVVDHVGIAQRYFGGTIRAKNGGALTIPVKDSPGEGRRASEFNDLFAVYNDGGMRGFLARLDASGNIEPLYWLRKSVTQKADSSVLPTDDELMDSMGDALTRELDRI